MIPDIKNTTNQTQQGNSMPTLSANIGTISKLQSEIKLIKNLSLIRVQGSENVTYQGKPAQLLRATTDQKLPFTLVNTGPRIAVDSQQMAKITLAPRNQASLTFTSTTSNNTSTENNVSLASRIVELIVTSSSTTSDGNNLTNVSDGKNTFQVMSQTSLQKGDIIRVLVDANNNLQVIPSKSSPTTPLQVEALRQSLPKQLSAPEMSQLIKQLQAINTLTPSSLTPQSQRALAQLIQGLPSLENLTQSPDAMKQAIQTSGQFSESLLKDASTNLDADLKMNLSRLDNATTNQQPQRPDNFPTEQVANAIERVTTNQLRHFSDSNQTNAQIYPLQIDLPVKDNQTTSLVQLKIDKDSQSDTTPDHERRWLVKLNFDFEETGRFEVRMGIQANKVGIVFAAEKTEAVMAIKQQMGELKRQLTEKDIQVQRLEAFQTRLQEPKNQHPTQASLIDVRT